MTTLPGLSSLQPPRSALDSAKVILPLLLAALIFGGAVFGYFLPAYERALMDGRRQALLELTQLAVQVLNGFHERELAGELSRPAAQSAAAEMLRELRHGWDGQEYFWINDTAYRLIMHPYRGDLEDKNLADLADPTGKRMFAEFVRLARERGDGFVQYLWQWRGNAQRLEPKLSHVRHFAPWDWVVGTGMYVNDVHEQVHVITRNTHIAATVAAVLLLVIAAYIVHGGIVTARARRNAERDLLHHQENLERTVAERTVALQTSNASLEKEIAERRVLEDQLRQLSCSDELTGLLNRRGFFTAAECRLAEAERSGQSLYLVYADLDNMKGINDRLGHAAGDHALRTFGDVLHEDFRAGDIGARLGGDEFAMLLTGGADYGSEAQIVERVQRSIVARNRDDLAYRLEASVGVVRYMPGADQTLENLIRRADAAMYACKQARKNATSAAPTGISKT